MTGRTHLLGGLLAGMVISTVFPTTHPLALVVAATLAGPLPDIDHPGSTYGRYIPLPGVVVSGGKMEGWRPQLGFHRPNAGRAGRMYYGSRVLWHRGPTHSVFITALFGVLLWAVLHVLYPSLALSVSLGATAGYLSHILLDLLNVSPLALWWPFRKRGVRFWFPRIRVGSFAEKLISVVMAVAVVILAGNYTQSILR